MMIFVDVTFEAAHRLPNVPEGHKCGRMHGHSYGARIEVAGEVDPFTGFIVDYADVKEQWDVLHEHLDHNVLNGMFDNPTCEIIAEWIGRHIKGCSAVELRETATCGARWEA